MLSTHECGCIRNLCRMLNCCLKRFIGLGFRKSEDSGINFCEQHLSDPLIGTRGYLCVKENENIILFYQKENKWLQLKDKA